MSCCGNGRAQLRASAASHPGSKTEARPMTITHRERQGYTYFQYQGGAEMTVMGPLTGKAYYFDHPGATLAVDIRDKGSLMALPQLKRME
jgi:hypothetical protein